MGSAAVAACPLQLVEVKVIRSSITALKYDKGLVCKYPSWRGPGEGHYQQKGLGLDPWAQISLLEKLQLSVSLLPVPPPLHGKR